MNGYVYAITINGSSLYAGGWFTEAGYSPADNIAWWDGSSWHPLGFGVNGSVWAIAVSGSSLYAGGQFTEAGGSSANYISCWDGSSWHPLGNGVDNIVYAIAVSGPDVYVGGSFTQAGQNPANRIARWFGDNWYWLGSGVGESGLNRVLEIAVSDFSVYAGGWFSIAGGNPANNIARWDPNTGIETTPGVITGILHASPNPTSTGTELLFQSIGLSPMKLEIYDAAGRLVRAQDLGTLPAGSQAHYWDGLDGNGHALAQGVYFLKLSSDELQASTRVVLVK